MLDGFQHIEPNVLVDGTALNIDAYRDRISPYCNPIPVAPHHHDFSEVWIDTHYGYTYGSWVAEASALYGRTLPMPDLPIDKRADRGFLRLPFVRVPRITARNAAEIETILTDLRRESAPGIPLLLRGQTKEHTLSRSPETLEVLYGERDAVEPSLLPSATRHRIDVNEVMPIWTGVLKWALDTLPHPGLGGATDGNRFHTWFHDYSFYRFALSMAQHYGLPSSGLDVTPNLDVALFFALSQFEVLNKQLGHARYSPKTDWTHSSVIYVFSIPTAPQMLDFTRFVPRDLPATRPTRQEAFFLHHGWGYAMNSCARFLAAAIYLEGDFQPSPLPSPEYLFPLEREDPLMARLNWWRSRSSDIPELQHFLSFLYEIV